jgi:hypothetical protein
MKAHIMTEAAFLQLELQFHWEDLLIRIVYIADHLGLKSLSPLMYYFTFMQATLIHLHNKTRLVLVMHPYLQVEV